MKGVYVRFLCLALPELRWLYYDFIKGPFSAAYHEHFDGGWVVEIACENTPALPRSIEWKEYAVHGVSVLEFYSNSLCEVGVYVDETGAQHDVPRQSAEWKREMGRLASVLDSVDISHPRAVHASEYSM